VENWVVPFLITISYVVVAIVLGVSAGRGKRMDSVEEWGVAGRTMGPIIMYLLIGAGGISAYTFLGAPGWAYSRGVPVLYVVVYLTYMAVVNWYFGPRVWELGKKYAHVTQASAIRDRYESPGLGALASFVTSIGVLSYAVLQTTGSAYILNVMSGGNIPLWVGVIISLAVISIYIFTSGLRAVGLTNAFQGALMFVVAWTVGLWVTRELTGQFWFGGVFERIQAEAPELMTLPGATGEWSFQFWTTSILISIFSIWQTNWVWWMGARSRESIRNAAMVLPTYYLVILPMLVVGFAGIFALPNLDNPDTVSVQMALEYLPAIITGLLGAGTLAAAMSSSEPVIHAVSLSYSVDIAKPLLGLSDRTVGRMTRWLIFPVMGLLIAPIAILNPASLVYILLIGYGFIGQSFPAILGMFFWPRATKQGAFWGLLAGFVVTTVFSIWVPHPLGIHAGIWGLLVNTPIFIVVSLLTKPVSKPTVERFFPDMADEVYAPPAATASEEASTS
jgi:SSS family solute:Na+ symporter